MGLKGHFTDVTQLIIRLIFIGHVIFACRIEKKAVASGFLADRKMKIPPSHERASTNFSNSGGPTKIELIWSLTRF